LAVSCALVVVITKFLVSGLPAAILTFCYVLALIGSAEVMRRKTKRADERPSQSHHGSASSA
jgi:hypothetical protein